MTVATAGTGSTTFSQAQVLQTFVVTLEKRKDQLVDSVLKSHPTLERFRTKAKSSSGTNLRIPVKLTSLGVTGYTDSSGSYSKAVSADVIRSAVFNWPAMLTTPWTLDHREVKMNEGSETQIINLVQSYIKFAEEDHANALSAALFDEANFTSDSERIIPLTVLVDDTSVVGNLDPAIAANAAWKSTVATLSLATLGAESEGGATKAVDRLIDDIYFASGVRPTAFSTGRDFYRRLKDEVAAKNQNMQERGASQELLFQEMTVNGNVVRLDPDAPVGLFLALSEDHIGVNYLSDEFMKVYNPTGSGTNDGNLNTTVLLASTVQFWVDQRNCHGKIVLGA